MKPPCDELVIKTGSAAAPCEQPAEPWILAATILGSSMAFIDGTVVNVALPALQSALGATVSQVQWVVECYALFLAALLLVGGSLGDLYGRRKIFAVGVILFAGASFSGSNLTAKFAPDSGRRFAAARLLPTAEGRHCSEDTEWAADLQGAGAVEG